MVESEIRRIVKGPGLRLGLLLLADSIARKWRKVATASTISGGFVSLKSCSQQKVVAGRSLARIKEAHEVEQVRPDINGLRSIRSDGSGHDGVRWRHGRVHVGSGHAV